MSFLRTILLLLALAISVSAADYDGGTTSPFSFGVGARDLSLGSAGIAVASDATAVIWNPARLARAERLAVTGFHANLFESSVAYQYFGFVVPTLDFGTFGIGVSRLGIDGIEKRDANRLLEYTFDDSRLGFNIGYGRTVSNYDLGLVVTLEHHSLDDYSATSSPGLNLSIGRRLELAPEKIEHISLVLCVNNLLQPGFSFSDENISYVRNIRAGLSLGLLPKSDWDQKATLSLSIEKRESATARFAAGLEYSFDDLLHLRGGLRNGKFSFGTGIGYKTISFDYALVDRDLGSIHMFTLTSLFGKSTSERRTTRMTSREAEFNNLMSIQLTQQNSNMISVITLAGEESFARGYFEEAVNSFDRALFLARTSETDTTHVYDLLVRSRERLDEVRQMARFTASLDSAQTKLATQDYLAARHFASLALEEIPHSAQAQSVVDSAELAIEETAIRERLIDNCLTEVDSLLSYGLTTKALSTVEALRRFQHDNDHIEQTIKRVEFEYFREKASTAYARRDYQEALRAIDTALVLFPNHQWCLNLKSDLSAELRRPVRTKSEAPVASSPLSAERKREAEIAYQTAQRHFKNGDLTEAITFWEEVERIAPDYMSVREYLVDAYKFVGVGLYGESQLEEAISVWSKAISLQPGNTEISGYISRAENEIRKLQELSFDHE